MKKTLITVCVLTLLSVGCVQVSGTKSANGTLKVNTHRMLWASQDINFQVKDEKGFTTSLQVKSSTTDSAALGAVTEAAVKAAISSTVK